MSFSGKWNTMHTHTPKVLWWFFPKSHLQKIKVGFCQHNISPPLVEDLFGKVCFEAIVLMNQTFGMLQPLGHSVLNTHAQKLVFEPLHWWWWLLLSSTCLNDSSGFFKNIINIEERERPKKFYCQVFMTLFDDTKQLCIYDNGAHTAVRVVPPTYYLDSFRMIQQLDKRREKHHFLLMNTTPFTLSPFLMVDARSQARCSQYKNGRVFFALLANAGKSPIFVESWLKWQAA